MNLIDNASQWHKLWSVRLAIITAVLSAVGVITSAYVAMSPALKDALPDWVPTLVALLSFVAAAGTGIARVVRQTMQQIDDDTDQAGA